MQQKIATIRIIGKTFNFIIPIFTYGYKYSTLFYCLYSKHLLTCSLKYSINLSIFLYTFLYKFYHYNANIPQRQNFKKEYINYIIRILLRQHLPYCILHDSTPIFFSILTTKFLHLQKHHTATEAAMRCNHSFSNSLTSSTTYSQPPYIPP